MTATPTLEVMSPKAYKMTAEPFKRSLKKWAKSSFLWGLVFGFTIIASASSYLSFYPTKTSRELLSKAFGQNLATNAIFGPAYNLDKLAGFIVLKSFFTLIIVGAIWAILSSSKLFRGEEESGLWEHFLSGTTTLRRTYFQVLAGSLVGMAVLWLTVTLVLVAGSYSRHLGLSVSQNCFYAISIISTPVIFISIASLASQIFNSRKAVNVSLGWSFGIFYALRLVGDSGIGLHWLDLISPIGWVELLHPMIEPKPIYLFPIFIFSFLCLTASAVIVGKRDLGQALFDNSLPSKVSKRFLGSDAGFSLYLAKTTLYSWLVSIVLTGAVLGLVSSSAGATLEQSSIKTVFERIGASGNGTQSFLGISFEIVAALFSFMNLGQITSIREYEVAGHLDISLTMPESRLRWITNRIRVTIVAELLAGVACALFTWGFGYLHGGGPSLTTAIFATLNALPPSIFVIGAATLAFGLSPSKTAFVGYFVIGWSMMVEIFAGLGKTSRYFFDTSLYHQMSPYPATKINLVSAITMSAIGLIGTFVGVHFFRQRDIISN